MFVVAVLFLVPRPTKMVCRSLPVSGCVLGLDTPMIPSSKWGPLGAPFPVTAVCAAKGSELNAMIDRDTSNLNDTFFIVFVLLLKLSQRGAILGRFAGHPMTVIKAVTLA